MKYMSVLRPKLVLIGNRCYRKNPHYILGLSSDHAEEETIEDFISDKNIADGDGDEKSTTTVNDMYDDETCSVSMSTTESNIKLYNDETNANIYYNKRQNAYVCELDVSQAFFGGIIGKSGETKQRIEQDTQTHIQLPRRNEYGPIIVKGLNKQMVQSACTRIQLIIDRSRQQQPFTHFLSIPICMTNNSLKAKILEFKQLIMDQCGTDRGISDEIFQNPNKLHLTIGTLVLMTDSEVETVANVLYNCENTLVKEYCNNKPFVVRMKGLEYMNDDPSYVDVLYSKIELVDHSQRLQLFVDRLNDMMLSTGLMKQQFERIKLHVTIMNSLLRKDHTGILQAQKTTGGRVKFSDRESFDAKTILRLFSTYDFGELTLDELHLSIMHEPNRKTGYYGCTLKIPLR
ncbi:unnamed protein product [Didymodactylos carnosus]|uniref:K Homology domain-containing protein n=1 Tax=Didymodactylos carnosus TaxID=1234261 RepID=A0A814CHE6_9BILA|nr:unnamed protein product [Didymodactylos carnosus]CAF3716805.1 unnamed protein product [Didymodactylos carnosus]